MRALSLDELLAVWERGGAASPAERALLLLAAAHPDVEPHHLARLSVGRRDARLIALRGRLFGARLLGVGACPACGEQVEMDFDPAALGMAAAPDGDGESLPAEIPPPATETLRVAGHEVTLRAPDGEDLAAIAGAPDVPAARDALLARCILSVRRDGADLPLDDVPGAVRDAAIERLSEIDPSADVQLALTCPACDHAWSLPFDIAAFLWREIEAWAGRMLREVHVLASAYGWSERDILQLSAARRRAYLERVAE